MRTIRCSGRPDGGRGVCLGGCLPRGMSDGGVSKPGGRGSVCPGGIKTMRRCLPRGISAFRGGCNPRGCTPPPRGQKVLDIRLQMIKHYLFLNYVFQGTALRNNRLTMIRINYLVLIFPDYPTRLRF